jgi:hypothetical protein
MAAVEPCIIRVGIFEKGFLIFFFLVGFSFTLLRLDFLLGEFLDENICNYKEIATLMATLIIMLTEQFSPEA